MKMNPIRFSTLAGLLVVMCVPAMAQPVPTKLPDSVAIFPAGGRRGSTIDVHVVTEQSPPGTRFYIRGPGIEGDCHLEEEIFDAGQPSPRRPPTEVPVNYPRQWKARVKISGDARTGTALWDTFCAAGGSSGSLPFVVGELPEVVESESNSTRDQAHRVELPVTVNGQIHGERDLDYFQFELEANQVVHIEVLARRLGSRMEPIVAVVDESGNQFTLQRAFLGDDPVAAFRAPHKGIYLLRVGNVSVQGSPAHVYRINLTHKAVPLSVFPVSVPAGRVSRIEVLALTGNTDLQTIPVEVFPEKGATQVRLVSEQLATIPTLAVIAADTVVRDDTTVPVGAVLNSRLPPSKPLICEIPVKEKTHLNVRVVIPDGLSSAQIISAELRGPSDTVIKRFPPAAVTGAIKVQHDFRVRPGTYRLIVRSHGAPPSVPSTAVCQVQVTQSHPGFTLSAGRNCLGITQGATLKIPLTSIRTGGFTDDIQISAVGLPNGVIAEQQAIQKGTNKAELVFRVKDDVPTGRYVVQINGMATVGDVSHVVPARFTHRGHDSTGVSLDSAFSNELVLTVRHKPLFRLYCLEAYQYAHRGTVYPYGMTLQRLSGFEGTVTVQQADRQNRDLDGIEFPETQLEQTDSEFMMPIYLPETMHINIQSQSQLYTQAWTRFTDATGTQHSFIAVAENRNMIRTMPTVVQLRAKQRELECRPGETVSVDFDVRRTSNMRNEMTLTCCYGGDYSLEPSPTQIPAGAINTSTTVRLPKDVEPGIHRLKFRASGKLDAKPGHQVVTEAEVLVRVLATSATNANVE